MHGVRCASSGSVASFAHAEHASLVYHAQRALRELGLGGVAVLFDAPEHNVRTKHASRADQRVVREARDRRRQLVHANNDCEQI
jgi:hypothetical protein